MENHANKQFDRILLDLNAIVISILADHPGHDYLFPPVKQGFEGESNLLVYDYCPFRVQYILMKSHNIENNRARNAVQRFVRQPIQIVSSERKTILNAYEISTEKNHDVYDSFLIALARRHDADAILTADTGFDALCHNETFQYFNPVPDDILSQFADID